MRRTSSVKSDWSGESAFPSRLSVTNLGGGIAQNDESGALSRATASLVPNTRKVNDLSDLTIDKLKHTSLGLYGRDKELKQLKNSFDQLSTDDQLPEHQQRQLILISGYSGTGKTALTKKAFKESAEKKGGLFVQGKFDLNLRNEPYSGINSACAEICGAILQLRIEKPSLFEQFCSQLRTELGSELELLTQVMPALADVVDIAPTGENEGKNIQSGISSAGLKNQFNFAFLRFVRAISRQFAPLIFVLDDLQWADGTSLDLLDILLTDVTNAKFMMVGIYRSNEVDETHIFHRTIEDLKTKSQDQYFEMTQLEIGNLDFDAVHKIIQEVLRMDADSRTVGLADVCHKKTHGNAFFLLQFLSMLKEHHLLRFNFGKVSWTWDDKEIEAKTTASDNVADILKSKMIELSNGTIDVLTLASCLGSTFETKTLKIVWDKWGGRTPEDDNDVLTATLETLKADGYIVSSDSTTRKSYSWGHDKIQEAALSLVPETERDALAAKIGGILASQLDENDLDSAIFVVVNLLNRDKRANDEKARLDLARLNYRASRKAISFSAFENAAEYAAHGIELLPPSAWVDCYELTLQMYTIGARAEGFIGNVETMERYCTQVLLQEDRPMEDKFGVYHTWIDSVMNRGLLVDARDLLLEILGKFNCRFPKNSVLVVLEILRHVIHVRATLRNSRDTSKMRVLKDTTRIELMKLLDKLGTALYFLKDDRVPLPGFRALNWTLKYGYCDISSMPFANTGLILSGALNDLQGGSKYGEQALMLMEKSTSQSASARTMFVVFGMIFPWTKPLRSLLKPLLQTYDVGLQTGDTESATWAIFYWLLIKFETGSSLETLEADLLLYFRQMKTLKREHAVSFMKYFRQTVLNLMGRNNMDNPTHFPGDALSEENLERFREDPFFSPSVWSYHGVLFTYFGEHVRNADMVIKMGHDVCEKATIGSPSNVWDAFLKGVSCFAAAQETGKQKYSKMGQIMRSKIKKWQNKGNPNVQHYEALLDAEWMACKGETFAAIKQYEVAILVAARRGYQNYAGLATERLGEFQLKVMGDREEAAYQIDASIKYWREWGAMAKVRHLQEKYADLMPQPSEIVAP